MFYDPTQFAFVDALRSNVAVIRAEVDGLSDDDFEPWLERNLYDGDGWRVFPFIASGLYEQGPYSPLIERCRANAERCPKTSAILRSLDGIVNAGFSWMGPGTHIVPHRGDDPTLYRCHLGLVDADDCALAFGDDVRQWHEGECLVFDDTVMHEAWNRGDHPRIVLLCDFKKSSHAKDTR